jgi:hypothetical protein
MKTYEQVQARISPTIEKSKKLKDLTEADIMVLKAYGLMQLLPDEENKEAAMLLEEAITFLQK